MQVRSAILALLLSLSLALAGCSDGGDDGGTDTGTSTGTGTDTGTDTGTETASPVTYTWSNQTETGQFTTVVISPGNAATPGGGNSFEFEIAAGTARLELAFTANGGPLSINIADPDCDRGTTGASCEVEVTADDGETVTWGKNTPKSGTWGVVMFGNESGPWTIDWTAEIARLVPE